LNIKLNELSDSEQQLEVTLEYGEISPEIENAYNEERKNITLDGFRKGKAPIGMIKKIYGEAIEYKASEKIANKKFWDFVDSEKLKPVSTPQIVDIDFTPGSSLSFKIKFEIKPKLRLKDYKGIEVEKPLFKIKEGEVQKEIDYLLKPFLQYQTADLIENSSFRITVNLQRLNDDGTSYQEAKNENMVIDLDDEKVNKELVTNAIGRKTGEVFGFSFVDEHYHGEEMHIEKFNYRTELLKIEKMIRPEITEEIVKKISGNKASTLDEFSLILHKNFEEYYAKQSEEMVENNLLNIVVKNNDFVPPAGFVSTVHKRFVELERENAKRYKVPHFDEKSVAEYYKPRAEWNAKWQIILENLADAEGIKVEDAELEQIAQQEAEKTGISVAKLVKYYKDTNRNESMLEEKVIKFLKENAVIKEVDAEKRINEKKGHKHES